MELSYANERMHARLNRLFAAGVFAISFIGYLATVAPTVCFWDCGEYTATCHSLEVPHPPGNPFFIMFARVVSMALFFIKDYGLRINLISVFSSALMSMLIYCIIVRTFVGWLGVPDTGWKRIVMYLAGAVGGLFAAFGSTVWFCSVEAEVNTPVLVPIVLCTWLTLVWAQSADERRDRLLVLVSYIAFLGIGIHMYSMITLGPLFLYVIIIDPEKRKDWRLWGACFALALIIFDLSLFMAVAPLLVILTGIFAFVRWNEARMINLTIVGLLIGYVVMTFIRGADENQFRFTRLLSNLFPFLLIVSAIALEFIITNGAAVLRVQKKYRFVFFLVLFAIVGFSSHLYLPVRSALNPMIDENHPATYGAFKDYLSRKQYGTESMITRMFWRRATLSHQFGIEGHMGFGGFFLTQFYRFSQLDTQQSYFKNSRAEGWGKLFVYLLPVALALFGMYFLYKKHKPVSVLLGSLFLMTTVVLVFYHNFSDGTTSERRDYMQWVKHGREGPEPTVQREVRVRDYFYIAGFMFYGMWIGIAAGGLLFLLYTNRRKFLRTTLAPLCTVLFAAAPALPLTQNMPLETRKGDFVPFDYAYNLLMSCEKDGILFTNGDNDTFPLWALQEAYNIRRDVRIVNLSLLNTRWYVKQLKRLEPRVPVSLSIAQIDRLDHTVNPLTRPLRYTLPNAGITVTIPPRREHPLMRIQDQMVVHIVDAARWKKPVYMSVTVSEDNLMGLGPYLQMQGLVYRVKPREVAEADRLDLGRTLYLLDHVYRYTGLGDGTTPLNESSVRMLSNFAASFLQIGLVFRKPLRERHAEIKKLEVAAAKHPDTAAALALMKKRYDDTLALVLGKLNQCISLLPWDWRPRALRHEFLIAGNRLPEAETAMREALKIEPANAQYLQMMAQVLTMEGKKNEASDVLRNVPESSLNSWETYASIAEAFAASGCFDSAIAVMQEFASLHPGDRRAMDAVAQLERLRKQLGSHALEANNRNNEASQKKQKGQ